MPVELSLTFPDAGQVSVRLHTDDGIEDSPVQSFTVPIDQATRRDLTWYLETYPVHYTTEVDDQRAAATAAKLKDWDADLFRSVLSQSAARRLFNKFQDSAERGRLLTISSLHPAILALPWELLCDPDGTFLFLDTPRISIRRRLPGSGRTPYRPTPKNKLHLLFVVSRPDDAGLIDPRADPMAVMDALDAEAPGRVSVEFLRPPTLQALISRLNDDRKPQVDILHFDGHGAYDPDGRLAERARQAVSAGGAGHLLRAAEATGQHGYLLFEDEAHKSALVPASVFGDLLQSKRVGLVILSACQSAMVSGEDALGSVAPRLIRAGISSVLAMTQSVLVSTTRALCGHFYAELAAGRPIGASVDAARTQLYAAPIRGERQRASGTVALHLQDWFVPALYQAGADGGLLTRSTEVAEPLLMSGHNLSQAQESGFHGRWRELRDIERWFVGGTRRIVLSGFGGQGKTALATEAGRWLLRTGLFERVCFVSYAGFQGTDAVQIAVATLGTVLQANLIDATAASGALLQTPTLLILDNLEALAPEAQAELLTEASVWSAQGRSRVLITTRPDDVKHPDYPGEGSNLCRHLRLGGLAAQDAVDWFQRLWSLPPEPLVTIPSPDVVREVFAQVGFHPLSINVLTTALKQRRIADVAEALSAQLASNDDPLLASLNLSLERLTPDVKAALPKLGVFRDGVWEPMATRVLELKEEPWARLRDGLRQAGLVAMETIPGVSSPFLRFHPTLAPAMRARLSADDLARLGRQYRAEYYQLSAELDQKDRENPEAVRGIALRELPNLLAATFVAIEQGDEIAANFVDCVGRFLGIFGRARARAALQGQAGAALGQRGSEAWYLTESNRGEQLYMQGHFAASTAVFGAILKQMGDSHSFNRSRMLSQLARGQIGQGQLLSSEACLRQALLELLTLPESRDIQGLRADIHSELARVLRDRGDLDGAQAELEAALAIDEEVGDQRAVAARKGNLGSIYSLQRNYPRAVQQHQDAIAVFERLNEPAAVAVNYHQLGVAFRRAGSLNQAENAYREAVRILECLGDQRGAAETWLNLAVLIRNQGRPTEDVEPWYRKAIAVFDAHDDQANKAAALNNLASTLRADPERLDEARALAEHALAIKQMLDAGGAEIWTTQHVLAQITLQQGDAEAACGYRAQERQAYAVAPIAREHLRPHRDLILAVLTVLREPSHRPALEEALTKRVSQGWTNLVTALRSFLDGARDEDALCQSLDREDALIVTTIFRCLAVPVAEQALSSDTA